jgi:hypothetical protein
MSKIVWRLGEFAQAIQEVTDRFVEITIVSHGFTGDVPDQEAKEHGIQLEVIKQHQAKRGLVLRSLSGAVVLSLCNLSCCYYLRDLLNTSDRATHFA